MSKTETKQSANFDVEYVSMHASVFVPNYTTFGVTLTETPIKGLPVKLSINPNTMTLTIEYAGLEILVPSSNIIGTVKKRS